MLRSILNLLDAQKGWSPLLLRLVVGATFLMHGYSKVFDTGILETGRQFDKMGIPLGGVLGPLVPIAEFFGGICVVLGIGTRLWALMQACTMGFAIAFVHVSQGYKMHAEMMDRGGTPTPVPAGFEWQALLLAACLVLLIQGAGSLSLDALLRRRWGGAPVAGDR